MIITPEQLRSFTTQEAIKEDSDDRLKYAIMMAEAKLKTEICDETLAEVEGSYPEEIIFAVKRLAEYYAYDLGEESRSLSNFESEKMGDYSYTKGGKAATVADIFYSLGPLLAGYNKCEIKKSSKPRVKMRRL